MSVIDTAKGVQCVSAILYWNAFPTIHSHSQQAFGLFWDISSVKLQNQNLNLYLIVLVYYCCWHHCQKVYLFVVVYNIVICMVILFCCWVSMKAIFICCVCAVCSCFALLSLLLFKTETHTNPPTLLPCVCPPVSAIAGLFASPLGLCSNKFPLFFSLPFTWCWKAALISNKFVCNHLIKKGLNFDLPDVSHLLVTEYSLPTLSFTVKKKTILCNILSYQTTIYLECLPSYRLQLQVHLSAVTVKKVTSPHSTRSLYCNGFILIHKHWQI